MVEALQGAVQKSDDEDAAALVAIETCANRQRAISNDVLNVLRLKAKKLGLQVSEDATERSTPPSAARSSGEEGMTRTQRDLAGVCLKRRP